MAHFYKHIPLSIRALLIAVVCYAHGLSADTLSCYPIRCAPQACLSKQPCGRCFIAGELLYWRAYQRGFDECISTEHSHQITDQGNVISHFRGKRHDLHFPWRPGYRVGVGYVGASCWDMVVYWTDFHSRTQEQHCRAPQQRWSLDFQVVDGVVGYTCRAWSCLTFRPFIGVRGAKIDQALKICRSDAFLSTKIKERNTAQFAGAGPLLGVEANVRLGCGFSFYVEAATSILYGNYDVKLRKFDRFQGGLNCCRLKKKLHGNQTVFDAALGLAWETCVCDNLYLILKIGAEHHAYFDYNRLGSYGDLSLDGGTFSAAIGF